MAHSIPEYVDETLYWLIHSDKDHDLTDQETEYVSIKVKTLEEYEKLIKIEKKQDKIFSRYGGFFKLEAHAMEFTFDLIMESPVGYYLIFAYVGKRLRKTVKILNLTMFSSMFSSECLKCIFKDFTADNFKEDCNFFPLYPGGAILVNSQMFYDKLAGKWEYECLRSTNLYNLLKYT